MADEQQNVIVNAPNSAPPSTETTTPQATQAVQTQATIAQAENYGAMTEAFRQSQTEAQQTRLDVQSMQTRQTEYEQMMNSKIDQLVQQNNRLITVLEQSDEDEIQSQDNLNGQTTIITPPIIEVTQQQETPPKRKQSRLSLFLFGRDDENEM